MNSFLQTKEWLEFQKEVGHKVWRFAAGPEGNRGSNVITANIIKHKLPLGKSYLYIPHGPEINFNEISGGLKNEISNFFKYLKDLAKEENSIFVKMEPLSDVVIELMYRRGVKRSNKQVQPYRTVIIDLDLPEEHLLGKMHPKTRYNINLSAKKGLKLVESDDVEIFWKLLKQTAKNDQFSTHPKEYYEKLIEFFRKGNELKTKLFLVQYENKYIGGGIVMIHHNTAYYLHGAMDRDYKSLMAPYFMHWEIIKKFKDLKFRYYDLWGVDAKRWPGVTRFKLGWGGEYKEYPGSFDLAVSRFWYLSYNLARKIF